MDVEQIRNAVVGKLYSPCAEADIIALLAEVDKLRGFLANECKDWADTHTAVAEMARPIVGDELDVLDAVIPGPHKTIRAVLAKLKKGGAE